MNAAKDEALNTAIAALQRIERTVINQHMPNGVVDAESCRCPQCEARNALRMIPRADPGTLTKRTTSCVRCGDVNWYKSGIRCRTCAKNYRQTETYKQHRKEGNLRWKKSYKARKGIIHKAHIAVNSAVRYGRLEPSPFCLLCWTIGSVEGHHPDYAKMLEVVWLCRPCHQFVHGAPYDQSRFN